MLNSIEQKLLALALDKGAFEGEADAAAVMLVRKLRGRGATADGLFATPHIEPYPEKASGQMTPWHYYRMTFGKHEGEMLMDVPISYLRWVLNNCTRIQPKLRNAIYNVVYE